MRPAPHSQLTTDAASQMPPFITKTTVYAVFMLSPSSSAGAYSTSTVQVKQVAPMLTKLPRRTETRSAVRPLAS